MLGSGSRPLWGQSKLFHDLLGALAAFVKWLAYIELHTRFSKITILKLRVCSTLGKT